MTLTSSSHSVPETASLVQTTEKWDALKYDLFLLSKSPFMTSFREATQAQVAGFLELEQPRGHKRRTFISAASKSYITLLYVRCLWSWQTTWGCLMSPKRPILSHYFARGSSNECNGTEERHWLRLLYKARAAKRHFGPVERLPPPIPIQLITAPRNSCYSVLCCERERVVPK